LEGYGIALAGVHQKWNAAVALAALHALGIRLGYESVADGLSNVRWPGRFERIESNGIEVILDGAHNPQAAKVLRETWISEMAEGMGTLIFGAVESKDISGILAELKGLTQRIIFCKVGTMRGLPTAELVKGMPEKEREGAECYDTFSGALMAARNYGEVTLVAGSLFLVGEARAELLDKEFLASAQ
jgi:dihydrofolate synthase/folylpolyglutamate synthase